MKKKPPVIPAALVCRKPMFFAMTEGELCEIFFEQRK